MGYFISNGNNIIVNVPYMEAYIPESLFKSIDKESEMTSAVAYMDGDAVSTVGVFNVRIFESDEQKRESVPLRTFNYPSQIKTYPTKITKQKLILTNSDKENASDDAPLPGDEEEDEDKSNKYYILHYYKGDIMMEANTEMKVSNCEKFSEMLSRGKIPNTIPYGQLQDIWAKNFQINDTSSGAPSVVMQLIIAEQARWAKNPAIPFRKKIGKMDGKVKETDYSLATMRDVASYNSTFAALTFEDIAQMICSSINMTRQHKPQNKSPIEKVLSF